MSKEPANINQKSEGDCGYICFYKEKQVGVYAPNMVEAQARAAKHFKVKKAWNVKPYLCENRDGKQVLQSTLF